MAEGAIDNIGFEKGLSYWNSFLRKNGYVAVACPTWLTDEHSAEMQHEVELYSKYKAFYGYVFYFGKKR